jgi:hypothetical protein
VPASFDARYSTQHEFNTQSPPAHLIGTLQLPGSATMQHLLPTHSHSHMAYSRVPLLDLGVEPPSLVHSPTALSPAEEYTFNLPQSGLPEQHMPRASYNNTLPSSTQGSILMTPLEHKPQPPMRASPSGKSIAAGSSSPTSNQAGPSRPRREASNLVIACRQWYVQR